jgi:hypothetical protein
VSSRRGIDGSSDDGSSSAAGRFGWIDAERDAVPVLFASRLSSRVALAAAACFLDSGW